MVTLLAALSVAANALLFWRLRRLRTRHAQELRTARWCSRVAGWQAADRRLGEAALAVAKRCRGGCHGELWRALAGVEMPWEGVR